MDMTIQLRGSEFRVLDDVELDQVTGGVAGGVTVQDPEPIPEPTRLPEPVRPGDFL